MNKLLTTLALLCFSVGANAQPTNSELAFLKVDDPNVLEYSYNYTPSCPFTPAEATQIIEGVIIRSRIRTSLGLGGVNDIYLDVSARCLLIGSDTIDTGYVINWNISYGDYPLIQNFDYGNLVTGGLDGKPFFLQRLQTYTENAITDFVEVNFLSDSN